MKSFEALQKDMFEWSQEYYGDHESPHFVLKMEPFPPTWKVGDPMPNTLVALGSLVPLMNLTKCLGDLAAATRKSDIEDILGSMMLGLCDYASREGFPIPTGRNSVEHVTVLGDPFKGVIEWTGRLYYETIRMHLGVCKDGEEYRSAVLHCVSVLICHMQELSKLQRGNNLLIATNKAWNSQMGKRITGGRNK